MPPSWTRRRVRLPWGRLSVYLAGEGPPLLLLHGLGGSGRYWEGVAPSLAARRLLIAPDLPGFGRSDKPRVDYSRDFHVDAMRGLLDAVGVDGRLDIAGHSMGGVLGALLAVRDPPRVASLALVATPFPRRQLRAYGRPRGPLRLLAYRALQRIVPVISPLVRSATFPQAVIADYLRHTVDSYHMTSNALIWDPTVADELAGLSAALGPSPQLLLYSDEDTTIAPDNLPRWRTLLPAATVEIIPGAHQLLLRDHFRTLACWYASQGATAS